MASSHKKRTGLRAALIVLLLVTYVPSLSLCLLGG